MANEQEAKRAQICDQHQRLCCWVSLENSLHFSLPVAPVFTATCSNLPHGDAVCEKQLMKASLKILQYTKSVKC